MSITIYKLLKVELGREHVCALYSSRHCKSRIKKELYEAKDDSGEGKYDSYGYFGLPSFPPAFCFVVQVDLKFLTLLLQFPSSVIADVYHYAQVL